MARCVRCGGDDAERACPALGGDLCPRRCAEHPRREIQCPEGDWEEPLALAYVAYGHADENGERAIDVFVRELETSTLRQPGGGRVDFDSIYAELALPR